MRPERLFESHYVQFAPSASIRASKSSILYLVTEHYDVVEYKKRSYTIILVNKYMSENASLTLLTEKNVKK